MTFFWRKLGRLPIEKYLCNKSWFHEFAQAPCSYEIGQAVRIYFSCRPPPDSSGQYVSYTAWIDLHRDDLFKVLDVANTPILDLGGAGHFDEFGIYPTTVIKHEDVVRAYYGGWTRCESTPFNVSIGCAESIDGGRSFARIGSGPILSYSPNEPFILSGPKIRKFKDGWQLFYIAGTKWKLFNGRPEPVYKIRMAISSDGIRWRKLEKDLIPSVLELDEAQASPDVFYANGKYHMFFCYRYSENYRNASRGYRIGYAYSFDLENWVRDDSKAGISVSDSGWDSEMVSYPHIFNVGVKTYMAYLGNDVGRHGFGFAELVGSLE